MSEYGAVQGSPAGSMRLDPRVSIAVSLSLEGDPSLKRDNRPAEAPIKGGSEGTGRRSKAGGRGIPSSVADAADGRAIRAPCILCLRTGRALVPCLSPRWGRRRVEKRVQDRRIQVRFASCSSNPCAQGRPRLICRRRCGGQLGRVWPERRGHQSQYRGVEAVFLPSQPHPRVPLDLVSAGPSPLCTPRVRFLAGIVIVSIGLQLQLCDPGI